MILGLTGETMGLRFLLLGHVDVVLDGASVEVESVMTRGLLATLLLTPNQFIPASSINQSLWDRPPASASSNLRTYAARLRCAFATADPPLSERLTARRGSGYRIEVRPGELDLLAFREAAREGRRRLVAVEDCAEARLALGDTVHLVADLHGHVALHPLRERGYSLLMRALYRSGEPSTALAVYGRLRMVLATELGTEPSRELQLLHRAVLRHDDAAIMSPRLGRMALAA